MWQGSHGSLSQESNSDFSWRESSSDYSGDGYVPPRNITRRNFESAIPAVANPYTNYQPHIFNQSSSNFESPYQISSRIIITNSGKVQYERNILGNKQQNHGGFHFKRQIPLPPRHTHVQVETQVHCPPEQHPLAKRLPFFPPPRDRRASDPQWERSFQHDKRSSVVSDCDDAYIFIAPGAMTPPTSTNHSASPSIASESYSQISNTSQSGQTLSDNPSPGMSPRLPPKPRRDDYDDVVVLNVSQKVHMTPYVTANTSGEEGRQATERPPEVAPKLPASLSPQRIRKPAIIPRKNVKKPKSMATRQFLSLDDNYLSHPPCLHRTLSIHEAHAHTSPPMTFSPSPSCTADLSTTTTAVEDDQLARGHADFASAFTTPISPSPESPPTPKPRNRVRFNMTAGHSNDDSSISSSCVPTAESRTRSISTPIEPESLHITVSDV